MYLRGFLRGAGGEGVTSNNLISVTQALSVYSDFSKISPHVLEHATARGTEVHRICAAIAKGLWVPRIPAECAGYVESFRGWFKAIVEEVIFVEREFVCTCYQYVGHPDLGVVIRGDNGITIPDIKTPVTAQKTWAGQNSAYWHLVEEHGGYDFPIIRSGSLMLNPEGKTARLKEYTENSAADFNAFLAALTAYRYFKGV